MDGNEGFGAKANVSSASTVTALSFIAFFTVAGARSGALSIEGVQFPQQAGMVMTVALSPFGGQQFPHAAAAGPARRARTRAAAKAERRLSMERQFATTPRGELGFPVFRAGLQTPPT